MKNECNHTWNSQNYCMDCQLEMSDYIKQHRREAFEEAFATIDEIDPRTFMEGLTAEQWQGANTMRGHVLNKLQKKIKELEEKIEEKIRWKRI